MVRAREEKRCFGPRGSTDAQRTPCRRPWRSCGPTPRTARNSLLPPVGPGFANHMARSVGDMIAPYRQNPRPAALPVTVPRLPSDRRGTLRTVPPAGNRRGRLRPPQSRSPSCRACTGSRTGRHPAAGRHGHHDGSARGLPGGGACCADCPGSAPDSGTAQAFPSGRPGRPRSSSAAANSPRGGAPTKGPVLDGTRSRRGCAVNRDRPSADADPPPVIAPSPKPAWFGAAVRQWSSPVR